LRSITGTNMCDKPLSSKMFPSLLITEAERD
jgi:hypothetical protein